MRFYLPLILFLFLLNTGCSATKGLPPKFIDNDFSPETAQIMPEHDFAFASLAGKKVFFKIEFAKEGDFLIEDYNIISEKKKKIEFKESDALKDKITSLFKQNGVIIVNSPASADQSITVKINKITSVLEEIKYDWDNFGFNLDNWAKINWGIIVEAYVYINNTDKRLFRRVVVLNKDLKLKRTGTYAVIASHTETEMTTQADAHYVDGSPLASTAIVQKQDFTAALIAIVNNDWAGNITLFNPRTKAIEKSFSFDTDEDWDGFWTGKITDEKKALALDYYATPRGYFTVLAYDLMEFIFEEVAKEASHS